MMTSDDDLDNNVQVYTYIFIQHDFHLHESHL